MIKHIFTYCLLITLFYSCSDNQNENLYLKNQSKDTHLIEIENSEEPDYALPSVIQMSSIFKKEGLKFDEQLLNPTSKLNKYLSATSDIAAINLGIYSADLAYCLFNNQLDKGKDYFKSCRELSNKLGLAQPFDKKGITKRIENNISRIDSMLYILASLQSDIDDIIQQETKEYYKILIFCGGWIETQYIALNNILKQKEANSLKQKEIEQILLLKDILRALKIHENQESSAKDIIQKFSNIESKITQMPVIGPIYSNNEISENNIPVDSLHKINFTELHHTISSIRTEFTNQ